MIDPNGFVMDLDITDFSLGVQRKIQKWKFKEILEFPPENSDQLKYSVLEFIKSKYFHYPISVKLFKSQFINANKTYRQYKKLLETLDFE